MSGGDSGAGKYWKLAAPSSSPKLYIALAEDGFLHKLVAIPTANADFQQLTIKEVASYVTWYIVQDLKEMLEMDICSLLET